MLSYSDYAEAIEKYGTDGAMIGRGALIKPWVFEEIKEQKVMDPSSSERMDMLKVALSNPLFLIWSPEIRAIWS